RPRQFKERKNYFEELDKIEFKMRFRLNKETVRMILHNINGELQFRTERNNAISAMYQLLLTLRLYATGFFLITMGDFAGVSTTSAHRIVHRVSKAIARLQLYFIHFPTTREEIRKEQLKFFNIARFPKVIGCIDCTQMRVQS
ncbi:Putative nuclease HARBI1, partial [Harpegnathos saltator]